jgi:hypothetical protein
VHNLLINKHKTFGFFEVHKRRLPGSKVDGEVFFFVMVWEYG